MQTNNSYIFGDNRLNSGKGVVHPWDHARPQL